jgi:hypothetical protein
MTNIAVVGALVGVALGSTLSFLAQNALANRTRRWQLEDAHRTHRWRLEDVKRQSYAEFLTSISTSYAKAEANEGDPYDADLLRATAVIELIADKRISKQARSLQKKVTCIHTRIRTGGRARKAAEKEVPCADHDRYELIDVFQSDLDILLDGDNGQAASRGWGFWPSRYRSAETTRTQRKHRRPPSPTV